jgi:hypothetical protein
MDRADMLTAIASTADQLTEPTKHAEPIPDRNEHRNKVMRRVWVTEQPSLLDQLAAAVMPGEVYVDPQGPAAKSKPGSTPPARLDAVDRLLAIEASAALWMMDLRIPMRDSVTSNIRALVGAAGGLDSDKQQSLLDNMRVWRLWAATVVGWHVPAWRPNSPCMVCEKRDVLRVRLDKGTACCMACGAVWDRQHIDELAEFVKRHRELAKAQALAARLRAQEQQRKERAARCPAA